MIQTFTGVRIAIAATLVLAAATAAPAQTYPADATAELAAMREEINALRADLQQTMATLREARQQLDAFKASAGEDSLAAIREWDAARRGYESTRLAVNRERARLDQTRSQLRITANRESQRIAAQDAAPKPQPGEAMVVRPENNAARPGFVDPNSPIGRRPATHATPYGYGSPLGIRNYGSYNNLRYGGYGYSFHGTTVHAPGYYFRHGTFGLQHVYDYYPGSGRYDYVTPHRGHYHRGHGHHGHGNTINVRGGYNGDKLKFNFKLGAGGY